MQSVRFERNGGRGRGNGARNHNDDDEGGIPLLQWSSDLTKSNFFTWKEKLSIFALKKYGHLGSLFETGEYYEPPEVRIPVVPQGQIMDEFERHAILRRIPDCNDALQQNQSVCNCMVSSQ
jgi:hypothetical protein